MGEQVRRRVIGAVRSTGLSPRALTATASVPDTALPGGLTLNRVCRPDVWDDPDWLAINRALAMPDGDARLHRKIFEWTHCVYGLERLGGLCPTTLTLGLASRHERNLYYL